MLLAIDAGNTNVVFAVFDTGRLLGQWRISTDARRTADEYGVWLTQVLEHAGIAPKAIDGAVLASVVPQALFDLRQLTKRYFNTELLVISDPRLKIKTGIGIDLDNPAEVGADRLVNAYEAWQRFKSPLIVVDFGTATTFDVVDGKGVLHRRRHRPGRGIVAGRAAESGGQIADRGHPAPGARHRARHGGGHAGGLFITAMPGWWRVSWRASRRSSPHR